MAYKVSVIIPNFNGERLLAENLPLVINAQNNPENRIVEVIVVDDGSTDKSVEFIKNRFSKVKLIRHKINRGFPATVNTGVRAAKGNFLVFLNTDVIPESDFVARTLKYFDDPKVFAISFHEDGFGWAKGKFYGGYVVHEAGLKDSQPHQTFWVSGGSGIFRRDIFLELGSFDEKLFSPFYWEDIDLSYRALKRGYKLLWVPEAKVLHQHESTTQKISLKYRQKIQERNQLIFIWKNISSRRLIKKHVTGLFSRLAKHPGYILVVLTALVKLPTILKAKKRLVREEKVSDEAIFASFK